MSTPAVSILLPVRNGEPYLSQALDSLFRQSFREWEVVAVDDHSTDSTPAILHNAAKNDSRVRVVHPEGKGLVPALSTGLSRCRAEFVARMDADDVSHPLRLERQLAFLSEHSEIDLVACGFRHFPRSILRDGMLAYEKWQNALSSHELILRDLFVESPFVHPSVIFRKSAVEAAGGYRDDSFPEDYDLWLRLAAGGCRFARLPETLFFWRDTSTRATRTSPRYSPEAFRACKAHHLKNGFLAGCSEVVLAGAGLEGRAWCRTLHKEGIRVGLWLDVDPRKQGRVLHGAPVVSAHSFVPEGGKMLVTIGSRGARDQVRKWAAGVGLREWSDFVCVT